MWAGRTSSTKEEDYDCVAAGKSWLKQNQAAAATEIEFSGAQCSKEGETSMKMTQQEQPETTASIENEADFGTAGQVSAEDESSDESAIESTCTILRREAIQLDTQPREAVSKDGTIDTFDCDSNPKSVSSNEAQDLPEKSSNENVGGDSAEQVLCARRLQLQHSRAIETNSSQLDLVDNLFMSSSASSDSSSSTSPSKQKEIIISKRNSGDSSAFQNLTSTDEEVLVEIDLNREDSKEEEQQQRGSVTTIRMLSATATVSQQNPTAQSDADLTRLANQNNISSAGQSSNNNRVFDAPNGQTSSRQAPTQFRGFNEAPAKISFASQRVKEYFESFRGSGSRGESVRLYQFFKSTRTELVACLLFALISSQALIVGRSLNGGQQLELGEASSYQPQAPLATQSSSTTTSTPNAAPAILSQQPSTSIPLQLRLKRRVGLQQQQLIINGLAQAFTVASLTQVFGHISGCHLIPAVSLALYVKGHISRARLGSYLAAQALGSFLGVALLGLLTSSQMSPSEYSQLVATLSSSSGGFSQTQTKPQQGASSLKRHQPPSSLSLEPSGVSSSRAASFLGTPSQLSPAWSLSGAGARTLKKRAATKDQPPAAGAVNYGKENVLLGVDPDGAHINWNDIQGSETILLSIIEQQQQRQRGRREQRDQQASPKDLSPPASLPASWSDKRAPLEQKTITAPTGTYQTTAVSLGTKATASGVGGGASSSSSDRSGKEAEAFRPLGSVSSQQQATSADESRVSGVLSAVSGSELAERRQLFADLVGANEFQTGPAASASLPPSPGESVTLVELTTIAALPVADRSASVEANEQKHNKPKANKRAKRTKLVRPPNLVATSESSASQQQGVIAATLAAAAAAAATAAAATATTTATITTTTIAAPEIKLNSGSGRYINLLELALPESIMASESIRQCIEGQQQQNQHPKATFLGSFEAASFAHCLSLSNSSQMFIFQLLATLLIVLVYLVNVDPRRVDLGFKSLSIGLAYFVASVLTLSSGGFFGNPFHLLALSWLAPTGEWQAEWFVYLVTPLVAGLFGAISHEYIDFTSLRNRNKQLHLRRSFYSLENLTASVQNNNINASSTPFPQKATTTTTTAGEHSLLANGFGGAHRELEPRRQQQGRQPCNISETFQQETTTTTSEANSSRLQQQRQRRQLFRTRQSSCSSIDCALSSCSAELNWQQQDSNSGGGGVSIAVGGQPIRTSQQQQQQIEQQRQPQGSLELSARRLAANHLAAHRGSNRKRAGIELVNSRKKFVKPYSRLLKLERHKQLERLPCGDRDRPAHYASTSTPPASTATSGRLSATLEPSSPPRAPKDRQQQLSTASGEVANGNLTSCFNYRQVRRLSDFDSNFLISSANSSVLSPVGHGGRLTTSVGPL